MSPSSAHLPPCTASERAILLNPTQPAKAAAFYSSQLAAAALVARKRLYSLHIVREPWDSRRRAKETSEKASLPPAHRVRAIPFLPYRARALFTHAPSRLHRRLRLRRHHRRASPHSPIPRRHRVCSFFLITAPPSLAQPSTRRGRQGKYFLREICSKYYLTCVRRGWRDS